MRIMKRFDLQGHATTVRQEVIAGLVSFITIIYIVVVNSSILADAGIPMNSGIMATVFTAVAGCWLMGFWANVPIVVVPGMGINALFTYTFVHSMGLTWQEALGAVFVSGLLFTILAFTPLSNMILKAIPNSLKEAIPAGIGLLLTFIGLQKGGLVVPNPSSIVMLGNLSSPQVWVTIITLLLTLFLFVLNINGSLLIGMIGGALLAGAFGLVGSPAAQEGISFSQYASVFGAMSLDRVGTVAFWSATFSLLLVIVFENVGLIHGFLGILGRPEKFTRALRANAVSCMSAGLFGTSPTVSTAESAAGIAVGGKTGLTAVVTGCLFIASLFFIPLIKLIPDSAIAPVLIILGGLMIQSVAHIDFTNFAEAFPAFLVIAVMPLTFSIVDGIAAGFIIYPFIQVAIGKAKEVPLLMYGIAALFILNYYLQTIG
jgi:adenine/guanine/hypoxanthine permease